VESYREVFQHEPILQLRFVLMLEIRIVACQGGLLPFDDPFIAQWWPWLCVALVADPLVPYDHGELVAR